MQRLGRLLLVGYALAAAGSIAAHQAGAGLLSVVAIFWVGGAVIVAMLAALVTPFLAARPMTSATDDAALAEALRLWEEDRLVDQPATQRQGDKAVG